MIYFAHPYEYFILYSLQTCAHTHNIVIAMYMCVLLRWWSSFPSWCCFRNLKLWLSNEIFQQKQRHWLPTSWVVLVIYTIPCGYNCVFTTCHIFNCYFSRDAATIFKSQCWNWYEKMLSIWTCVIYNNSTFRGIKCLWNYYNLSLLFMLWDILIHV